MSATFDDTANLNVYSQENLLLQAQQVPLHMGYRLLKFYVTPDGSLAKEPTETLATFYYSPSGGTLRDEAMNIVHYSAKFDKFKGLGKA